MTSGDSTPSSRSAATSPHRRSMLRFAPWVLACGLIVAGAVAMLRRAARPDAESEVVRRILATALHRSEHPQMDDGGPVGPWWITAATADRLDGTMFEFRLSGASIELTAREARVVVDPVTDNVSFELHDVVFAVVPDGIEANEGGLLTPVDAYVLGPVPWPRDIIADTGAAASGRLTMHD